MAATAAPFPGFPAVQGQCPACSWRSLFLGSGGYITCAQLDCPDPGAASDVLTRPVAARSLEPDAERGA